MRRLFHSFYFKVSVLFLVLLLAMGVALILITMRVTDHRRIEVDQLVNRFLARDMARELEPRLEENDDPKSLEPVIHHMMVLNPSIEIYLLDGSGKILAFFAEPGKAMKAEKVDLGPVGDFLTGTGLETGPDPGTGSGPSRGLETGVVPEENRPPGTAGKIPRTARWPVLGDDPCHPGKKKHFSAAPMRLGNGRSGYLYIVLQSSYYDRAMAMLSEKYLVSALWTGLLVSLLSVGVIGLVLFAFLTKRLQRVARSIVDFKNGNFSRRIPIGSRDEVGDLAETFNLMADRIVEDMERLKQTDKLRRELVANVSHDLRSPFASIQGYVETILMKGDSLSKKELRRYLETIMNDSRALNRLIDDLFELSKLDAKQVHPNPEVFSLAELAQDVVLKFKPQAEKLNVSLKAEIPHTLLMVEADIAMIERVLSNLVENALKFTGNDGTVELRLSEHDGTVRVSVIDSGIGIPETEIPLIFNRFYRVDRSRSRESPGSGLGLAISQKILELHHSAIRVLSEAGKGSTFSFDLRSSPDSGGSGEAR
jgi:signal transduction histidine kinase